VRCRCLLLRGAGPDSLRTMPATSGVHGRLGLRLAAVGGRACCLRGAGCWGAGALLCLLVGRGELLLPV
jgi:hypothetical protein